MVPRTSRAVGVTSVGASGEREGELERLILRVRQWLAGGADNLSAWVLQEADRDAIGYRVVIMNLDSGKVYEVHVYGREVAAREIGGPHG